MIDDSDKELFRQAVEGQIPLDKDAVKVLKNQRVAPVFVDYDPQGCQQLSCTQSIDYAKNGVGGKIIKKLKKGQVGSPPTLDLHGQTVRQMAYLLANFIHQNQQQDFLHIIHGKGHHSEDNIGILKSQVVHFLKQHPAILAFNSCPAKDGGTGALFALLKH